MSMVSVRVLRRLLKPFLLFVSVVVLSGRANSVSVD